jgi:hypothetical protein
MPMNSAGIVTARDHLVVGLDENGLLDQVHDFADDRYSDNQIRDRYFAGKGSSKYKEGDTRGWSLAEARRKVRDDKEWRKRLVSCLYRPFDTRPLYYTDWMVDWPRKELAGHVLKGNLCLATTRSIEIGRGFEHVFCSRNMIQHHAVSLKEVNYLFPLYLYPNGKMPEELFRHENGRSPNLSAKFIEELSAKLKLKFIPDGRGDLKKTFGPEDVFHYIYAVFHSPAYRARYAEFLKIDFPRVPLTGDAKRFRRLCELGAELTALHLLESPAPAKPITRYPINGDHLVEKGHPKYLPPGEPDPATGKPLEEGRVYISRTAGVPPASLRTAGDPPAKDKSRQDAGGTKAGQYFEGVPPDVWAFHVGGYQVCEKWLKDRRERRLTYEETEHYQKIVVALKETIRLMAEVDAAIPNWPME